VYLLDTNVLSEIVRPVPNQSVMAKLASQGPHTLFASELTRFELRQGACLRRDAAAFWETLQTRVLPLVTWLNVTQPIAERAGEVAAILQRQGREPKDPIDPLLAATADVHRLTLVTRNVRDFDRVPGIRFENWFAAS
jgi:predicted nucleic acid-binding protein